VKQINFFYPPSPTSTLHSGVLWGPFLRAYLGSLNGNIHPCHTFIPKAGSAERNSYWGSRVRFRRSTYISLVDWLCDVINNLIIQPWNAIPAQFLKRLKCEKAPTLALTLSQIF